MSLSLALKARILVWTMLAVPCDALFCTVIVTHYFAASVVFAPDQDTALIFCDVRAARMVTLSNSTRLACCHSHLLHHYSLLLGVHCNHPRLNRHHTRLSWHHTGLSRHNPGLSRLSRHHNQQRHHARPSRHSILILLHPWLTLHKLRLRWLPQSYWLLQHKYFGLIGICQCLLFRHLLVCLCAIGRDLKHHRLTNCHFSFLTRFIRHLNFIIN